MTTKQEILEILSNNKNKLFSYGVIKIGLYGSYVRKEQTKNSDIDILIDFDPEKENYNNFMEIYNLLESLFQNEKIEVVTKNGLSPYIGPTILKEIEYA